MKYIIQNVFDSSLYWNRSQWVAKEEASTFTEYEKFVFALPEYGRWVEKE